jgi:phage/plasmid-associated DNA primase
VEIVTDFHTIFSANNIPVFSDKTKGARRRTLILPFRAHFQDNPTFEDDTFTEEFLGGLVCLILEETHVIRGNGYQYKFSDTTLRAKEAYDSEVNSAEAFANYLTQSGIIGFFNYNILKMNYEMWCGNNGLVPLGITTLKRVMTTIVGAERRSIRSSGKVTNRYYFAEVEESHKVVWLDRTGYGLMQPPPDAEGNEVPMPVEFNEQWGKS